MKTMGRHRPIGRSAFEVMETPRERRRTTLSRDWSDDRAMSTSRKFAEVTTTSWRRGFGAHAAGRRIEDNPFVAGADHEQWIEGWMERDRQAQQQSGVKTPKAAKP